MATKSKAPSRAASSELTEAPKLSGSDPVVFDLWVRAGGRCQFHGCNKYLLEEELTTNTVKIANVAHIVARSPNGPRGDDPLPISERNKISNLMLACTDHHAMIDKKEMVPQFPKTLLTKYKNEHESRILYVTDLGVEHETVVLRVIGNVRGDSVVVSDEEIRTAVLDAGRYPRYLQTKNSIELDLQGLSQNVDAEYWTAAVARANDVIKRLVAPAIENASIGHLSVFALARIPILVHIGNVLGDKVVTDFYQRHRDEPVGWSWRQGEPVKFTAEKVREGTNPKQVALVLSLSGKIAESHLPAHIDGQYSVYEISPVGIEPNRSLVITTGTLSEFQRTYQNTLRMIEAEHGLQGELHLFPAIPAPVAVICGRELLKDVSPKLHVYDRVGEGYELALTVN